MNNKKIILAMAARAVADPAYIWTHTPGALSEDQMRSFLTQDQIARLTQMPDEMNTLRTRNPYQMAALSMFTPDERAVLNPAQLVALTRFRQEQTVGQYAKALLLSTARYGGRTLTREEANYLRQNFPDQLEVMLSLTPEQRAVMNRMDEEPEEVD